LERPQAAYRHRHGLSGVTDAHQLAKQLVWAADTVAAPNTAFNIVTGDLFRWL
jgi:hypothetical protein